MQKYNIILTKYLVKTIKYLVDFMSKKDKKGFCFSRNVSWPDTLNIFVWNEYMYPLILLNCDLYEDLKKKHTLDQFIKSANGIWDIFFSPLWFFDVIIIS